MACDVSNHSCALHCSTLSHQFYVYWYLRNRPMESPNVYLLDSNPLLHDRWQYHLQSATDQLSKLVSKNAPRYHIIQNTIESFLVANCSDFATAVVTPTNSLAYMGAGFDRYLAESLLVGTDVGDYKVLEKLVQEHHLVANDGFLPLHSVRVVPLKEICNNSVLDLHKSKVYRNWHLEWIVSVPTMMVPSKLGSVYGLFHIIWEVMTRLKHDLKNVGNIFIPGIGTGYGGLIEDNVAHVIVGATLIHGLQVEGYDFRKCQLKKSLLVLFLLKQDYRKFEIPSDIAEMENHITEYGKERVKKSDFEDGELMQWDELAKCIVL